MNKVISVIVAALGVIGCEPGVAASAQPPAQHSQRQALLQSFGPGSLIIPMSNAQQDVGMLRAYGLVNRLVSANIPVGWAIAPTKLAGGIDFTIVAPSAIRDRETLAALTVPQDYRGGPFVVDSTNAAAALPIIDQWLAADALTVVHELSAGTILVEVERTLTGAPRVAVFNDGFGPVAFAYLNAAGITDSTGAAWTATSPDYLTEALIIGPTTTNDGDGLLSAGVYSFLASMHYNDNGATTDEVVQEVRTWLDTGAANRTHGYFQCEAVATFEDNANGRFLSTSGLVDDGTTVNPAQVLAPANALAQLDGTFLADTGSVNSIGLSGGGLRPNVVQAIRLQGAAPASRMGLLFGPLDGNTTNGLVTFLAGHDYTTTGPFSTNPLSNGSRLFFNGLFITGAATGTQPPQPTLTFTKSAPTAINGTTLTYMLSYANAGPGTLNAAFVQDPIPAGTGFVSATAGGTFAGGTVTWSLGSLAPGASGSVSVTLSVAADGSYLNAATLAGSVGQNNKLFLSNTTSTVRDTVVPDTTIVSGPTGTTNSASATFDFSSPEAGVTFECSLDGAAFAACTDPVTFNGLSNGSHTLQVRARDAAGNVDPTPASRTWTIDTTVPDTAIVSGPSGTTAATSATFDFSSPEAGVTFECSLDGAAFAACTDPVTFNGLSNGSHTLQVRARDAAGNVDPTPASRTWTIDTTVPDTAIVSGPTGTTNSASATFDFSSPEAGVTFECSLDGAAFAACTDPVTFNGLSNGSHTLQVRARDAAGNVDPTPASRTWTIDTVVPDTAIVSGPTGTTNSASATFDFSSPEAGVTFECGLDGAAFAACTDPVTFNGLSNGSHTLQVRARDAAGNVDPTPASRTWTIDTTVPDTAIVSGPTGTTNSASATFDFSSPEAGVTFECSLDGAAFAACTDPVTFNGLSNGSHTLQVRARDAAGNVDPTPASRTWTIDTVVPDTAIVSGPTGTTNSASATFDFSSPEAGVTFECGLDGAAFAACTDPVTFNGLSNGSHTLQVRARDAAGNVDPTPASRTWTIDTTVPDTAIVSGPTGTTAATSATFDFSSPEAGVTFECSLDGAAFAACTDPVTFNGLSNGSHTLQVRARDAAGNVDPTPASRTWTIDTTVPDTAIVSGPTGTTNSASATFDFSSPEAGVTFECSLDGAAFAACTDPVTFTGLADGSHTLQVRARDAAGNVDPTPASRTWTIDTTVPDTAIVSGPTGTTAATSATFDFSSPEAGVTFECSLDGAVFAACTDPVTFSGLSNGSHTLQVRARDAAGNVDPTPASRTWSVGLVSTTLLVPSAGALLSDNTPTFSGTTEPLAAVTVRVDGVVVCTTVADAAGAFTCTASAPLADGPHVAIAQGPLASNAVPFRIDATAPTAPIITAPAANAATSPTPTFSGVAEPLSTVLVRVDGALACTAITDALGNFSCVGTVPLSAGAHTVTATSTDPGGNVSPPSAAVPFTVGSAVPPGPPVISSPAAGTFTSDNTPLISGTATPGAMVTVSVDGAVVCSTTASAMGTFSCSPLTPLADGPHATTATAANANGTSQASAPTPFTVDTAAPVAPIITAPAANATTGQSPTFVGTSEPNATVQVSVDGQPVCTAVASSTGAWQCSATTSLAPGAHTVVAKATDRAGNPGADSSAVPFTVAVGQPPGAPTVTSPSPGQQLNVNTPLLSGKAEPGSTVTVRVDGNVVCTALADPSGNFACVPMMPLADGPHTVTAVAANASGPGASSAAVPFVIDTSKPAAPVVLQPANASTTSSMPTYSGTAEPGSTVTVRVDGQPACITVASAAGTFSCTGSTALANGPHAVLATAVDPAGNVSPLSNTNTFTVGTSMIDTTIVSGPPMSDTLSTATFDFSSNTPNATFECSLDGAAFVACTDPVTFTGLSAGMHTLQVRAKDASGNVDPTPASYSWTTALDSDLDGIPDTQELLVGTNPFDADSDDDGVKDGDDGVTDTDGDGKIDALDPDSDNDGIFDGTERGVTVATAPSGTNTSSPNFVPDRDPSTTTDPRKGDTDGDSLKDGEEDVDHNGRVDSGETNPNLADTDNDRIPDGVEKKGANRTDPLDPDTDDDGLDDGLEDLDLDGVLDPAESDPNKRDTDNGGVDDGVEASRRTNPRDPFDDSYVGGGGCGCGATGDGTLGWALALFLALLGLRRRVGATRVKVKATWVAVLLLAVQAGSAHAQTASESRAVDVQLYKPGPGRNDTLNVLSPRTCGHLCWNVSLGFQYDKHALVVRDAGDGSVLQRLVDDRQSFDLLGSLGLFSWLEIGVHLPLNLQSSGGRGVIEPSAQASGRTFGLGDLRLVPRAQLLKREHTLGSVGLVNTLGVALPVVLPTGRTDAYMGGGSVGAQPRVTAAIEAARLRLTANAGFNLRKVEVLRNLTVGQEFAWALAAEAPFDVKSVPLAVLLSVHGVVGLSSTAARAENKPVEVDFGLRATFFDALVASVGVGRGVVSGYGAPDVRVLAGLGWAPACPAAVAEPVCQFGPEDLDGFEDDDGCAEPDNDRDGVIDADDTCPLEPETRNQYRDEDGCPDQPQTVVALSKAPPDPAGDQDADGDGLVDRLDACPAAAEDLDGFEDLDGCPELDNDRDGIVDQKDKCPLEAEVINGNEDEDGCPDKGTSMVVLEAGKILILEKVFFATNKDVILARSFGLLKQVAGTLRANPQLKKLRVEGHTDSQGDDARNLDLSKRRAESVKKFLVEAGIDAGRLEPVGYGETKPVAENKTAKGREENRRVEFIVVDGAP